MAVIPGPGRGSAPRPVRITTRTKLSRALAEKICERIRGHVSRVSAAEALGVHRMTLWRWLKYGAEAAECAVPGCTADHHGPDGDLEYRDFCDLVMRAEGEAACTMTAHISAQGRVDWRAAAWWLERRLPEEFGEKRSLAITGPGGGPVEIDVRHDLMARIERLAVRVVEVVPAPVSAGAAAVPHRSG